MFIPMIQKSSPLKRNQSLIAARIDLRFEVHSATPMSFFLSLTFLVKTPCIQGSSDLLPGIRMRISPNQEKSLENQSLVFLKDQALSQEKDSDPSSLVLKIYFINLFG